MRDLSQTWTDILLLWSLGLRAHTSVSWPRMPLRASRLVIYPKKSMKYYIRAEWANAAVTASTTLRTEIKWIEETIDFADGITLPREESAPCMSHTRGGHAICGTPPWQSTLSERHYFALRGLEAPWTAYSVWKAESKERHIIQIMTKT